MPSSDLPDPVFTAFQPVAATLAELVQSIQIDPMRDVVAAAGRMVQQQVADMNAAIAAVQPVAVALASVHVDMDEAVNAVVRTAAQQVQDALRGIDVSLDTTGLVRVLQDVQAWRLTDEQWTSASRVLDDAYRSAEAGSVDDVPDELVNDLADTVRTFAASQGGFGSLTPELQRQLFAYFCGLLVLFALMQASFTSETADAVIEKTITLSPVFVLTAAVAGKAWDKHVRRPQDQDEPGAEEGGVDDRD
ncbi:hypothetical protein ABZ759_30520 [Streptomyces sp. NPDC047860]|uniref:hypothetical protein n=1 Tax=Streptomyces sp. NPDC047860 TaxID=3155743 RepID=UPI0033C948F4